MPSLEYRRERADLVQVYKIFNGIDKLDKEAMFQMSSEQRTRGHSQKLFKKRTRLNMCKNAFSNRVVNAWNNLPSSVVEAPTLNQFKSHLNKHWSNYPSKFAPTCYQTN